MASSRRPGATPAPRRFNGWQVLFTEPFTTRYGDLSARARQLKQELADEAYTKHRDRKLFAAVFNAVFTLVPQDPDRPDFRLRDDLAQFRRVKRHGLPDRYRLFYCFSSEARTIIFLYFNDAGSLRKEGDAEDPYRVFSGMVTRGEIGEDYDANYERWRDAHK